MTPLARQKLRGIIETHGLVEPPVWNVRTGNLVGGHQRLATLDDLHGGEPYMLDVAQIDVTPKREKELNVALNNTAAQGYFDIERLIDEVLRSDDQPELGAMGLTVEDLEMEFGELPELREDGPSDEELAGDEVVEDLKALRETKRRNVGENPDTDIDNVITLVFPTSADRIDWLSILERPATLKFMAFDELLTYLRDEYAHRRPGTVRPTFNSVAEQMKGIGGNGDGDIDGESGGDDSAGNGEGTTEADPAGS